MACRFSGGDRVHRRAGGPFFCAGRVAGQTERRHRKRVSSFVRFCLVLSRAILSDTKVRRQWMFLLTLGVLSFVFGGYFFGGSFMSDHPWIFLFYLAVSFGGLIFLVLFAIFDILMVRKALKAEAQAAFRQATRGLPGHPFDDTKPSDVENPPVS